MIFLFALMNKHGLNYYLCFVLFRYLILKARFGK
jgi:hypothetical protein